MELLLVGEFLKDLAKHMVLINIMLILLSFILPADGFQLTLLIRVCKLAKLENFCL